MSPMFNKIMLFLGLIMLILMTYKAGEWHGNINMMTHAYKFEAVCNTSNSNIFINDTCIMGEGNYSYKVNEHFYFNVGKEVKFIEKLLMYIFFKINIFGQ